MPNIRVNIDCIYAIKNRCKNKKVKRSLFGLGPRLCTERSPFSKGCEFKERYSKPKVAPPAPMPK